MGVVNLPAVRVFEYCWVRLNDRRKLCTWYAAVGGIVVLEVTKSDVRGANEDDVLFSGLTIHVAASCTFPFSLAI